MRTIRTKTAIKVLAQSDISLFKAHQRLSNQRALTLNSEVFIERFYPGLRGSYEPVLFPLTIIGPGARGAHQLTRMAMRSPGARDWHIKGEPIHDPAEEPGRYDQIAKNDFALMAFGGTEQPQAVTIILVSAAEDAELHAAIAARFELPTQHTMIEVSEIAIEHLRATTLDAYPDNEHPLDLLISGDTVEDVLFATGTPRPTNARPLRHPVAVSPENLLQQLLAALETTRRGEELFGVWLTATGHEEDDFKWVSQTHARSAYDYEVYAARWLNPAVHAYVEVKTTCGPFKRPIHMSLTELRFAAETENYRIARLYKLDDETPKLRILTGVQAVAVRLIEKLGALPDGVAADSLQIDPGVFEVELETNLPSPKSLGSDETLLVPGSRSVEFASDLGRKGPVQF